MTQDHKNFTPLELGNSKDKFSFDEIDPFELKFLQEANAFHERAVDILHDEILNHVIDQITPIDFKKKCDLPEGENLPMKYLLVMIVEGVLDAFKKNNFGICFHYEEHYIYNGSYWVKFDRSEVRLFLSQVALKMGIGELESKVVGFRKALYEQFEELAQMPSPRKSKHLVLVNLANGTFEISPKGQKLRNFKDKDFLTYQMPFEYDPNAQAPMFESYLNRVLPDQECQKILAEYLGYVFIPNTYGLKLEKFLLLYGSGANGKSVFFEVVNALLGSENVGASSLQNLTDQSGYFRAGLGQKLVNYASEISSKLGDTAIFKKMISGEPIEVRLPYKDPYELRDYAKLIFNVNELPINTEQTHAFYRRFLIVPFEVTIPEQEQDKELAKKITQTELSGVFNWILGGLNRLLAQKGFTPSSKVEQECENYKKRSDSLKMFLEEEGLQKSAHQKISLQELFQSYKTFCNDEGSRAISRTSFSKRLASMGFESHRQNTGMMFFAEKNNA